MRNSSDKAAMDMDDLSLSAGLLSEQNKDEESRILYTKKRWLFSQHLVFYLVMLFIYTIVVMTLSRGLQGPLSKGTLYTPAREAMAFNRVTFNGNLEELNPYRGQPSAKLDAAWGELLGPSVIRLTKDDLNRMNRSSVKLSDGSETYMGEVNVFHHLHCLKYLRDYFYYDYYKDTGKFEAANLFDHLDHCIDDLRQTLMCHADITVITYDWIPDYRKPWPNFEVEHECVNWDYLKKWTESHSFDGYDQVSLVHPQLGLSFPLVDGKIETAATGDNVHLVYPSSS